jgi:uncharacterized membrane protein (UPF0127 family)
MFIKRIRRRIEDGHAELAMQALELGAGVMANLGVEIGEQLVEEQKLGLANKSPSDRDALLFATARRSRLS